VSVRKESKYFFRTGGTCPSASPET